jgi:hypothetical protein
VIAFLFFLLLYVAIMVSTWGCIGHASSPLAACLDGPRSRRVLPNPGGDVGMFIGMSVIGLFLGLIGLRLARAET